MSHIMAANALCPPRLPFPRYPSGSKVENLSYRLIQQPTNRFHQHGIILGHRTHASIMTLKNSKSIDESEDKDKEEATKDNEPENNCGGIVAGLFGNLRIPASLVAGAALGSAFGLPLASTDGLVLGLVKRFYVLLMLGSMSSMLLTVLLSTICMNDIALHPPRVAKSTADYIGQFYGLEWMLVTSNFLWGNIAFAIGSMLRGWVFISCPLVGRGVLGVMGSFLLISSSIVLEYSKQQMSNGPLAQAREFMSLKWNKMKKNRLFALGILLWTCTMIYLVAVIPHIADFLMLQQMHN